MTLAPNPNTVVNATNALMDTVSNQVLVSKCKYSIVHIHLSTDAGLPSVANWTDQATPMFPPTLSAVCPCCSADADAVALAKAQKAIVRAQKRVMRATVRDNERLRVGPI